jgi:predicted site-specific integrase-resolvase
MSTEHQKYSLDNQAVAIQKYAEQNGFAVIKTYADSGKSGLVLKHREGLAQLLHDVVGTKPPLKRPECPFSIAPRHSLTTVRCRVLS